jgi:hypothetical protein
MSMPNPSSPGTPSQQALDPTFVYFELGNKITALETRIEKHSVQVDARIDRMDAGGTRGVEAIRLELTKIRGDFEKHEERHQQDENERKTLRRWAVGLGLGAILALVSNPFLVLWVSR